MLGGTFLVFYIGEEFRERPYGWSIAAVCIAFVTIISFITVILGIVVSKINTGLPFSDPETMAHFRDLVFSSFNLKNILIWALIVGITQLLLSMNDKFGQGLLWDFIRGKYHSPREETRIFMFVDLKSSTTIAEKLGNKKYYELLRDYFADVTDPIIYNKGQIYQYAGDEVIISWHMKEGIENDNCLKCYFDMKAEIDSKEDKYLERYGLVPEFKAGLHYGIVTAGEIGIIKRDITFSGDVLNTTSRIQTQCNEHQVQILSSKELLGRLKMKGFKQKDLGSIALKGREEQVELSTIELT
ncbi:MAG: adenylate/guanylate cyclase domain-containing protein [Bacteroidetes bacterium]|nr:adenylate/guanylate cyclase domain-containing protein [Bacteroidota bacterium]